MARWILCALTTFETSPLSTCTMCQQKSFISKGIQPVFEIFAAARRCWGGHWCKVTGEQVFYSYNGKVKSLCINNIWNFANFNLYTVPAKILYLHRYSTDFQNVRHSSKILRVGIWVERFKRAGILLLQWQGENLCACSTFEISHFQSVHCPSKNAISPMVFNRFSKSLPQHEDFVGGQLGGKFQARRYGTFAMARRKFCACTTIEISQFQPVCCASKNPTHVSPKVFNRFSKS